MNNLIYKEDAIKVINDEITIEGIVTHYEAMRDAVHQAKKIFSKRLEELPPAEPKQDREFMKLTVRNSNGRPYYSIIYLEFDDNGVGHDFEGYSSYSLDVISDYLKKYFIPSAQPEIIRCKDCKHWNEGNCNCPDIRVDCSDYYVGDLVTEEDFYCGFAKRREDE